MFFLHTYCEHVLDLIQYTHIVKVHDAHEYCPDQAVIREGVGREGNGSGKQKPILEAPGHSTGCSATHRTLRKDRKVRQLNRVGMNTMRCFSNETLKSPIAVLVIATRPRPATSTDLFICLLSLSLPASFQESQ